MDLKKAVYLYVFIVLKQLKFHSEKKSVKVLYFEKYRSKMPNAWFDNALGRSISKFLDDLD